MNNLQFYKLAINWTGSISKENDSYRNCERSHKILIEKNTDILGLSYSTLPGNVSGTCNFKTFPNPEKNKIPSSNFELLKNIFIIDISVKENYKLHYFTPLNLIITSRPTGHLKE